MANRNLRVCYTRPTFDLPLIVLFPASFDWLSIKPEW